MHQDASRSLPLADELSAVFARMSGLLLSEETVATTVGLLSSLTRETVRGAVGAGVSIVDDSGRRSSGSTDPRVEHADALQYELDEGPCLAAAAGRTLVRADDLSAEPRWPRWAAAAAELGLLSVMSAPMVAGDRVLGALKVYGAEPGAFTDHDVPVLTLSAAQAALLITQVMTRERARRASDELRQALSSRDLVSTAKGVLMARHGVGEETALTMLLSRSGGEGVTLRQAARSVVDSTARRRR
ncbi:GAF domain-containing protein [Geodermatophilus bullaregiensis]|uniref:GAF and ANTAR domain-containing protein n=1 Tax=Geodermatophilus bullaregiensis TaxID=1564160 RepID=UPI001956183D|nr:GAF and ANTAR domain-containing protein [Geodermatophilus bullaregiensis]MBM7804580.1 GAF domain-containing protein [Geodermatophilus bullaregiensis]